VNRALVLLAALAAGCGGGGFSVASSDEGGSEASVSQPAPEAATAPDLSHFLGSWAGSETISFACAGVQGKPMTSKFQATFVANGSGGLTYPSTAACKFDWAVSASGDAATLSDAPVVCSANLGDAGVYVFTYDSFALTSYDGVNLTEVISGTLMSGGVACTFQETSTATRP
jgi:hypothetical protein